MVGGRFLPIAACLVLLSLLNPPVAGAENRPAIKPDTTKLGPPPPWFKLPNAHLKTVAWSELTAWGDDDHAAAFETFLKSCQPIVESAPPRPGSRPFHAALQSVCKRAIKNPSLERDAAREFFESNFHPMRVTPFGQDKGFLTGYYEPIVEGSREQNSEFSVPLYRTPTNLAIRSLHRAAIEDGALAGRQLELCWLKDATDLFFAQIQGSARVRLEDGKILRLNYSGQNGWPYTPIGGVLIARQIVPREEMSMQRIREWIEANPKEGRELRRLNKSFVFFRQTGLADDEEPIGAQGVPLSPGRSIAVDRFIHVYGTPFFIEADLPLDGEKSENSLRRLWIAQDTGGAIRGPARADLYFGAGEGHAAVAGRIRHPGRFTILVPRDNALRPVPTLVAPATPPSARTASEQATVDQNPESAPRRE